jgi:transcriptional regulator with XRE-family HTH domain
MSYGYSARIIALNKLADRKQLGVRLGRACIKADLPVADLAARLGVSRQTVYNWFTGYSTPGERYRPSICKLIEQYV